MKRYILLLNICLFILLSYSNSYSQENMNKELFMTYEDSLSIRSVFNNFNSKKELPIGILITEIGKSFLKTPYVAQTLETGQVEVMVVNLRQFDCTTFAENCLAFAQCIKHDQTTIEGFISELKRIRYRSGEFDGYCSRLHYFSEWISDNEQKGLVIRPKDVMKKELPIKVNFMSKHPDSYPALYDNPKFIPLIAEIEENISSQEFSYLPKFEIAENENLLKEGDIVGITTNISGLDVAHVGIITFKNDRVHLLHASSSLKRVVVSDKPLSDFLQAKKSFTGIIVARPIE
ncbi:N-acetylmuramoyl-L-alanine amidase-like domain-containing protein [Sunxiuqinia sp. A32]|uniref:N-acetylmuramoyl-L-alanine amidase-like domain-containing protein n=1 Tax=Sunxiuqinia sp. A32 TaxID=3461496 RepID=UPI0040464DEA